MTVAARQTFAPPKRYTFRQLEELWIGAGGREIAAPTAAAIALAESGGNPQAINHNSNGSIDRGLWQINSVHGGLSTTDVAANVRAAVKVYNEAGGTFTPWATYNNGAYQKQLTPAVLNSGVSLEKPVEPQAGIAGILEGKIPGFSKEGKAEEGAEHVLEALGPPNWAKLLLTGVLLLAGAVLVVYGIMVAVRPRESALSLPRMPMPVPV